jgi:hypothetical protein
MTVTKERRHVAACSFCFKSNTDVESLVAGPGVFICDTCVALAQQLIDGKAGPDPVPLAPSEKMEDVDELLRELPQVVRAGSQVEHYLAEGVRRARELGATWARVGAALGMTRQSAWERFSGEE